MIKLPKFSFALRADLTEDRRFLPTKAEPLSTGYDCRAAQIDQKDIILRPGQYIKIPLGFRSFCPQGWWYELVPRSSSFVKKSLHALYGIIDESWEGETTFVAQYIPDINSLMQDLTIKFGDAVAQLIPKKLHDIEMGEISNEEIDVLYAKRKGSRGEGGFGSTDG